jgi:hypothetical protein
MIVTLKGAKKINLKSGRNRMIAKQLVIEKLEVVSVNENIDVEGEKLDIPIVTQFSINEMFNDTRNEVGDTKFFSYSALGQNNCQDFIAMLLTSQGLYTDTVKDFVYQDLSELVHNLPQTQFVTQGVTHLAALSNKYLGIGGNMTEDQLIESFYNFVIHTKEPYDIKKLYNHWIKIL